LAHDGGVRLHVHEFGPSLGRTVVALHGVTGAATVYRRLASRLPDFRLVAPDFRGHGSSPAAPPWDLSAHLRDVRETLDRAGIARFGHAYAPLDEALVRCALDYGKRPHVVYEMSGLAGRINDFDVAVLQEFVRGYAQTAGISLHLDLIRGENLHHIAEAAFKALGLATRQALAVVGGGIPSTKGTL